MTPRRGVSLPELLVATVLVGITVNGVYRTFANQEEAHGSVVTGQDAVQSALGVLEAELRGVAVMGDRLGGSDLAGVARDSVTFRAQRHLAFICELPSEEPWLVTATDGQPLAAGDSVLVFADGDPTRPEDDAWVPSRVEEADPMRRAGCGGAFPGLRSQRIRLSSDTDLAAVRELSPLRGFEWVTYTARQDPGQSGWSLVRMTRGRREPEVLVGGLAPRGRGLWFEYFDANGDSTRDPSRVSRMRIGLELASADRPSVPPTTVTTNLHLRNHR